MQLDTITMDEAEAREALDEYRGQLEREHTAEDAAIARGYDELVKGRKLIHLPKVIQAGGLNAQGWPALAVAQADQGWCFLGWTADSHNGTARVEFLSGASDVDPYRIKRWARRLTFSVRLPSPAGEQPKIGAQVSPARWSSEWWRSQVPVIPPSLRPRRGLRLYHVLWEVDEWQRFPAPPADPALIRHVGGDLWAVHGVWDLTELERAVLSGRS